MAGKIIGYIRVSTVGQNTERQLDGVALDKVFEEKVSAKTANRHELKSMLEYIREGDTVVVHDISRLARNIRDLHDLVEQITAKGVALKFQKEGLVFTGFAAAIFCRGVCAAILFFARRLDCPKSLNRPGLFRFGFCVLYLIRVLIDD